MAGRRTADVRVLAGDARSLDRQSWCPMALGKVSVKGGSSGRLGHSNMSHWTDTAFIKDAARRRRRRGTKAEVAAQTENARDDSMSVVAPVQDGGYLHPVLAGQL